MARTPAATNPATVTDVILSEAQIQQKVAEMAAAISKVYGQRTLHVIGLLDNGFMFMADLARRLTCPVVCQFVKLETHDVMENGHERRQVIYTPRLEPRGKDLLLVDCLLHTGVTLEHLMQQFVAKGARSIKIAVLVDKTDERRVPLEPDFFGFQMQAEYMVGYGLGHDELYRNLPYIGRFAVSGAEA